MAYFSIFAKGSDLSAVLDTALSNGVIEDVDSLFADHTKDNQDVINVRVAMALCFRVACFDSEEELFGFVRGLEFYLDPMEDKLSALHAIAVGDFEPVNEYFESAPSQKGYKDIVFLKNLEQQTIFDVLAIIRRYSGTHISFNGQHFISMETGFMPIRFSGDAMN